MRWICPNLLQFRILQKRLLGLDINFVRSFITFYVIYSSIWIKTAALFLFRCFWVCSVFSVLRLAFFHFFIDFVAIIPLARTQAIKYQNKNNKHLANIGEVVCKMCYMIHIYKSARASENSNDTFNLLIFNDYTANGNWIPLVFQKWLNFLFAHYIRAHHSLIQL